MRVTADDKRIAKQLKKDARFQELIYLPAGRWRTKMKSLGAVLVGVLVVLLVWQGFAVGFNTFNVSTLTFPTPEKTLQRLGEYLFTENLLYGHSLYEHIGASLRRLGSAVVLASIFGVVLGVILGYCKRIYTIGMVPVTFFQMIPGLAWLPIAILVFGLGDTSAIFIIFAVSSVVIVVGVAGGVRTIPLVVLRAARMMGIKGVTLFIKVIIPYVALPIVSSLRVGVSSAWRVLIAAEMIVGTGVGLGYSIELTRDLLDYVGAFACIAAICLIGLLVDRLIFANIEKLMRRKLGMEEGF